LLEVSESDEPAVEIVEPGIGPLEHLFDAGGPWVLLPERLELRGQVRYLRVDVPERHQPGRQVIEARIRARQHLVDACGRPRLVVLRSPSLPPPSWPGPPLLASQQPESLRLGGTPPPRLRRRRGPALRPR